MIENQVYQILLECNENAVIKCNQYLQNVMQTRGGRIGSGMGSVLETLWGYNMNATLRERGNTDIEVAWFPDHQYNDFAVVGKNNHWNPTTLEGEYFRLEAKSMQVGENVDEPKAHFNVLRHEIGQHDAILLLVWKWTRLDQYRVYPEIVGTYLNRAQSLAYLRDELHKLRGGRFINSGECPDCGYENCQHVGEPLNAAGRRERISGPPSLRVSLSTSHAANFGGMLRMLKASSMPQKIATREIIRQDQEFIDYLDFIHTHFPNEEKNFYSINEWRQVLINLGIDASQNNLNNVNDIHSFLRSHVRRECYKHLLL
ncbi:hypothetical protein [Vibrio sp. V23_P3S9T160]|uniref:hypothetical protein n=1 Tax=Vibrio sp. V23_P3S9T160 TaxID=1938675 RepID=UPI0013723136|nr:hypothetical protein [Vibrio sp. V23_P3S9T160]NAW99672.1 hypothetical protein [Vibrio sp. V23_P3S9T160]